MTTSYQQISVAPASSPLFSASIASMSGASQVLIQARANPIYLLIQNPPGNANVGVNVLGGTAVIGGIDTFVLLGGGSFIFTNFVATNGVTIIGTSTQTLVAAYA